MGAIFLEKEKSWTNNAHFEVGHEFNFTIVKELGMIDKGVPEIGLCLFQSNGIKTFLSNRGMHRQTWRSTNQPCTRVFNKFTA